MSEDRKMTVEEMEFKECEKDLGAVKDRLLALAKRVKSASVHHALQVTIDHLDTSYMWVSQSYQLAQIFGQAGVEQAVAAASDKGLDNGAVIQGDFTKADQ